MTNNNQLTTPLKPSEMAEALQTVLMAHRPPMLHGDPGVGKSDLMMQAADAMFAPAYGCKVGSDLRVRDAKGRILGRNQRPWFIDFRTALHDAVDLTGLPNIVDGKTVFAIPELLPTDKRGGMLFFDEINRGPDLTINASFSIVLDGTLGKYHMPDTWVCAAAVNDKDLGIRKLSAALTRRFVHLEATADLEDTCKYAVKQEWEPVIVAFLRMFPALLNAFDPQQRVSPNPRGWEFVSDIVAHGAANKRVEHSLIAGVIGDAAAVEFGAFLRMYRNLPSIDGILLDPKKASVPSDPGTLYAISAALGRRAKADNLGRVITYLDRIPTEYNVFAIRDAIARDTTLQSTPDFTKWAVQHSEVVL